MSFRARLQERHNDSNQPEKRRYMASKIAVTGTGRLAQTFCYSSAELGRDVKHEAMGSDGIASWCIVPNE